jgi:DNA-binding winged helix-turn-helix (wHTH) protein
VRIRFGAFTLCSRSRQLTRNGEAVHLTPKAFQLLLSLASDRPNVLSKAVLQERLWPRTFVAEANLSNLIAEIREAVGDRRGVSRWIRTAHGFGYAFCGEAIELTNGREPADDRLGCWLEWGRQRFRLPFGEHVIGRDADADIRLNASTVSRRHARLVVTATGALLEDFGSKNGTRLGTRRITSSVQLADGDAIHIGSLLITFHMRAPQWSTETQGQ